MFSQRSNSNGQTKKASPQFYSLFNGGYFTRHNFAANDLATYWIGNDTTTLKTGGFPQFYQDQNLLFWQQIAQQDEVSLAEETKFLDVLKNNNKWN